MIDFLFIAFIMIYMYAMGSFITWFLMRDRSPSSEQYWRNIISQDIDSAIESGSEINAYGAYLIAKNGLRND